MTILTYNNDESCTAEDAPPFIGNFHKTLPHNDYGEVLADAYRTFMETCLAIDAGAPLNFASVAQGPNDRAQAPLQRAFFVEPPGTPQHDMVDRSVAKLTSPMAGASTETHGPDPKTMSMPPAPGIRSLSTTAEMAELYSMALLRDVPLVAFQARRSPPAQPPGACIGAELQPADTDAVGLAVKRLNLLFDVALTCDTDPGRLRAPLDVGPGAGGADIKRDTLFRSGLHDEQHGPILSQFFMQTIGYGTQAIDVRQTPYLHGTDFLTSHADWLLAQNTGKDQFGRDYAHCNHYRDQVNGRATYYPLGANNAPLVRHISTMRDIARFVNRDALHQAYFNAALFLDSVGAPLDPGNPYAGRRLGRESSFATLGGPDLLTLVSEVASRALKVVWRQKWLVHRRCRPEVFGGLLHMQRIGATGRLHPTDALPMHRTRAYGIASFQLAASFACQDPRGCKAKVLDAERAFDDLVNDIQVRNGGTLFLPMAFSAGSPNHPAYGAGHATVAGACVTVLKAWFDEDATLEGVYQNAARQSSRDPQGPRLEILQPGYRTAGGGVEDFCPPQGYTEADARCMTVGGELNKVASNVAMGRSMGGVHWRSDNTRSLRLGEAIAIEILRKRTLEYAERPVSFTFRAFDRHQVHIAQGKVQMAPA